MVDALLDSWRVLVADGIMIDLRPYHTNPALEIITANGTYVPGYIDDSGSATDDIASDSAIAEVARQGRFACLKQDSFKFANYWDTLDGLLEYADKRWRGIACIPPFVVAAARQCIASAGSHYQVRVRRAMHIAVYKKQI